MFNKKSGEFSRVKKDHLIANAGGKVVSFCEKLFDLEYKESQFDPHNISVMKQA